ncbi:hypothetical protein [Fodinicurvata fenggangensis]|uniref:hypothetical protein n=1 Tax=Fodinicurvata fenggangensis TaxID=1121830 RepID=UPI0012DFDE07|nr:hypothetical protein [Fodinicurvata fenggangensis]
MDKEFLVKCGHAFVRLLDETEIRPRGALWVHNPDNDIWRLWIVGQRGLKEQEFYRIVAETITKNRTDLAGLDISSVELVDETHPAIKGLKGFMQMENLGSAHISNNTMNGFFMPDGIILRMAL